MRNLTRLFLLAPLLCFAALWVSLPSWANEPTASTDKAAREVVGTGWFGVEAPASASVFTCFTMADTTTPALFPWYSTVMLSCADRVVACWLQDATAITIDTDGLLTDASVVSGNGTDGRGACFSVQAGLPRPMRNRQAVFQPPTAVGRRSGACVDGTGAATGRPCDADADCTGSDTCDLTADRFPWTTGAYLCVTAPSGVAVTCDVNTEVE